MAVCAVRCSLPLRWNANLILDDTLVLCSLTFTFCLGVYVWSVALLVAKPSGFRALCLLVNVMAVVLMFLVLVTEIIEHVLEAK